MTMGRCPKPCHNGPSRNPEGAAIATVALHFIRPRNTIGDRLRMCGIARCPLDLRGWLRPADPCCLMGSSRGHGILFT